MKTQISRDAHDSDKRYSSVYQQQGRMLTDADWNALAEIVKERLDEALSDVVGSGSPRGDGLRVGIASPPPGFQFQGSRLYVDGVPARVAPADPAKAFAYANQADFPAPPNLPKATAFTFYADVWERTVDALEDTGPWVTDHLIDPALHGADTTTRTQTMAQVKWCPSSSSPEDPKVNPALGDSLLTVILRQSQAGSDPCDPCADTVAVARPTGNYLFRVEVHDVQGTPLAPTEITLKWSSENGAEHHRLSTTSPEVNVPPDFKTGGYVYEFFNDAAEKHLGVHLVPLVPAFKPTRGTLTDAYPTALPIGFDRVRRWDGYAVLRPSNVVGGWSLASGRDRETVFQTSPAGTNPGDFHVTANGDLVLVLHSLQLTFNTRRDPNLFRSFVAGDYWLAPVRDESIHPAGAKVLSNAAPTGIVHHYLVLAEIDASGILKEPDTHRDQRLNFPPLTDLRARDVDYLPACQGAYQLFEPKDGKAVDTVKKALDRLCDIGAQHVAFTETCNSSLYQGVEVRTVADALKLLCHIRAGHVEYQPLADCALFKDLGTVEQALNRLCAINATDIAFTETCNSSLYQGVKPKSVAEALHLLCAIQARHVGYDPPNVPPNVCELLKGSKTVKEALDRVCGIKAENVAYTGCPNLNLPIATVKDALDALCARPTGGGVSCRATVGKGGTFETLALAFASISPRANVVALCLCLLPGGHTVEEPLLIEGSDTKAINLTICGCGRGSQLTLKGSLVCKGLRSLRIENLLLQIEPQAQLIAQGGFEVTLEGLVVKGTASRPPRTPTPLDLQATLSVRVAECRVEFLSTLGLGPVTNLFTPLNQELGELFAPLVDDQTFEERQGVVAGALVALPSRPRTVLVRGLVVAIEQAVSLADTLRDSLRKLVVVITPPTPELPTVVASLADIRTAGLRTVPALVLVLEPTAGDTTLVDNEILGIVSVYGEPDKEGLTTDQIRALKTELRWRPSGGKSVQFGATPGRLSIDRNEISRLTFGGTPQTQLLEMVNPDVPGRAVTGVYRAAFLGQNRFTLGGNRVLAKDVRLTDNLFELVDGDLGAAIAETATYVGNGTAGDGSPSYFFYNLTRSRKPTAITIPGQKYATDDLNYLFFPV